MLEYQPVFDLGSGQVRTIAAQHRTDNPPAPRATPEVGAQPPEFPMPMDQLKDLLDQAFCELTTWLAEGRDHRVSVTVSRSELTDPCFVDVVEQAWSTHGLRGRALELVLDETTTDASDEAEIVDRLEVLSGLGVRLVFCDSGQNRRKLFALRAFPGHSIRLHDELLGRMESDPATHVLSDGVAQFAHALGQRVSARSVATDGQLNLLRSAACDDVQGSLFGAPSTSTWSLVSQSLGRTQSNPMFGQRQRIPSVTPEAAFTAADVVGELQFPAEPLRLDRRRLLSGRRR